MESNEKSENFFNDSSNVVPPKVTSFSIADILKSREERREQKEKLFVKEYHHHHQEEALDMRRKSNKYKVKHVLTN
ncbi:hypothetical protein Phum_PHUM439850 [Pediculus humanus corporis]|uniref:Uncharacterized protein n=1 Tax=Pediculus humanus subsp. corporis TaxID=121224 RepID=E0VTW3_PEDHC|nr:uncharacterized protein Phum_PHUM439850 [Pediculus humanus corporis]EEB16819.1 hypothetical protein Phum_PHUM439850 [Pediculus humanus corporis]